MLYMGLELTIAIISGWVISRLRMEKYLEDWVQEIPKTQFSIEDDTLTLADRISSGFTAVRNIVDQSLALHFSGYRHRCRYPRICA